MIYKEAEQFLYSLCNLPRQEYLTDQSQCKIYLKRLQFFLDILGNPEIKIPHYIHVTGTSGKGSVCHFLHSILVAANKHVGLTISPHPTYLTERWQVGQTQMTKKEFCSIVEVCKKALDIYARLSPYDTISFFELTTAIGLIYFARKKVDWAIVEVGCGGRYDATNIIPNKDIAIITTIGLDHTDILGQTKKQIAIEKAGIITPNCQVFTTVKTPTLVSIFKKECQKKKAKLTTVKIPTQIPYRVTTSGTDFVYKGKNFRLRAPGMHQIHNALLARAVAQAFQIKDNIIQKGLAKTKLPICFEIVSTRPLIILDGAHNVDKMKATVQTMSKIRKLQNIGKLNKIHLILGFSGNKDIKTMLKLLLILDPDSIACTRNTIHPFRKVASPALLKQSIDKLNLKIKTELFLDPKTALLWSRKQMKRHDIMLITGSLFVSGELRPILLNY